MTHHIYFESHGMLIQGEVRTINPDHHSKAGDRPGIIATMVKRFEEAVHDAGLAFESMDAKDVVLAEGCK